MVARSKKAVDDQDTKTRLLNTALRLFAESGFDAVSIRDLTAAAGTNLGAIGYHFGSKDGLIEAVLVRFAEPVNKLRLASLEAGEREAGDEPLTVDRIVRAFIEPAVRFAKDPGGDGYYFSRIFNIAFALRPQLMSKLVKSQYDQVALRFIDALSRALPEVPRGVLAWRYVCVVGAMLHVVDDATHMNRVATLSGGRGNSSSPDQIIEELVPFIVGGVTAPFKQRAARKPVRAGARVGKRRQLAK